MACYTCLVSWFTTPPANDNIHELPQFRKKTCPHCRAVVRERPAEVWAIKEMVAHISRSGLAPQFPPAPAPVAADEPAAAPVLPGQVAAARDAWVNIFPPLPRAGGPVPGLAAGAGEVAVMGMYDAEDAVYRCIDCMHEIWEGSCASCGRIYPGHDALGLGEDDDGEEDIANIYAALHAGHVEGFHPAPGHHGVPYISDSEGEGRSEDEESYEGSFIDDEGPPVPVPHARQGDSVIELSDSEDEDVRAIGRSWRAGRAAPGPIIISDGEEGSDQDDIVVPNRHNGVRRLARRVIEEEEEDAASGDDEDDGVIRGPSRRLLGIMEEDDSDDEMHASGSDDDVDDDGAIRGPSRRLRGLMEFDDDERYGGGSDDERFGGRSDDERSGGGSDAGEYVGGYGEFEDDF